MAKMTRRRFLTLGAGMAGALAASAGYVILSNEANHPVIERVQIPIANLDSAFDGFTIAVMSDFHLYPITQLDLITRAVQMTNALQPDLVVLLGDYVWRDVESIFDLAPALAGLNARHGVFTIMGNHDLWTNRLVVETGLTEAGLPILINQGLPISLGQSQLYLAGLDDGWSGQPDLAAALTNRPADAPVVLLVHEPDLADTFAQDKRISLQVSGHSHGGQIRLPGIGALVKPPMAWKYDQGLYRVNDMWLYTNRGIGITNEPIRFNCPPEITEITLVSGNGSS